MKKLMVAAVAALASALAFAEDAPEPYVIEAGQTLTITSQDDVDALAGKDLILRGTLDLNGFDVSVLSLKNLSGVTPDGLTYELAATAAKITNSGSGTPTFTVQGGSTYYSGHVDPSVNFTCNGGEAQIVSADGAFAPARFTMTQSTCSAFANPTAIAFRFTDVAGDSETLDEQGNPQKKLRLAEVTPTYRGVALVKYRPYVSTSSTKGDKRIPENWINQKVTDSQYWNGDTAFVPPAVVSFGTGNSGNASSIGCVKVDGYRLAPPVQPAYAPTSWQVYWLRGVNTGYVLLDSHENDPLNRPEINTTTNSDHWSETYSQNFDFRLHALGSPFGAETEIVLQGSSTLRLSTPTPFRVKKVSGTGKIEIDDGSVFAAKDLSDWTGSFVTDARYTTGIGREAKVAMPESGWNAAFDNPDIVLVGADDDAVVTLDGTTPAFSTRLADDEGAKIGLTVNAEGKEQVLGGNAATYSGETKVEKGTLRVLGKLASVTCRYIKIAPTKANGTDTFKIQWAMNEFKIFDADGREISLAGSDVTSSTEGRGGDKHGWNSSSVSGAYLIDGKESTRMLPYDEADDPAQIKHLTAVTIDMKKEVTFSSYDWYPSVNGSSPSKNRFPTELTILVSSDGDHWTTVDLRSVKIPAADADYLQYQGGENHFSLGYNKALKTYDTLDAAVTGTTDPNAGTVKTIKAQYFRFSPYETFLGGQFTGQYDYGWHVSEFSLLKDGEIVPWPAGTGIGYDGSRITVKNGGNSINNFANNVHTGALETAWDAVRCFFDQCGGCVTVNAQEPVEFDAYELWNGPTSGSTEGRMPRVWTLEVSMDKVTWYVVDNHAASDSDVCPGPYGCYGPFSLKNRWLMNGAANAIGDDSLVTVSDGATFSLATDYERIGGLAGRGSVSLVGATLALNNVLNAPTFRGKMSGSGRLVLETGAQFFENADLTGVTELAFEGGAFGGTANFGALRVTGDVKLILPETVVKTGGTVRLFTYTSIDDDGKAALENATLISAFDRTRKFSIDVGETAVTVNVSRSGMAIFYR